MKLCKYLLYNVFYYKILICNVKYILFSFLIIGVSLHCSKVNRLWWYLAVKGNIHRLLTYLYTLKCYLSNQKIIFLLNIQLSLVDISSNIQQRLDLYW